MKVNMALTLLSVWLGGGTGAGLKLAFSLTPFPLSKSWDYKSLLSWLISWGGVVYLFLPRHYEQHPCLDKLMIKCNFHFLTNVPQNRLVQLASRECEHLKSVLFLCQCAFSKDYGQFCLQ